jgi:hypothetical protein
MWVFSILLHIWQPYFCSDHIAGVSNGSLSLFGVLLLLFSLVFQFRWNVGLANFIRSVLMYTHTSKQPGQVVRSLLVTLKHAYIEM